MAFLLIHPYQGIPNSIKNQIHFCVHNLYYYYLLNYVIKQK